MTAGHAAFGYHLWLVPEGNALHRLQGIVDRLAEAYDGPVFTPHVTLLAGLAGEFELRYAFLLAAALALCSGLICLFLNFGKTALSQDQPVISQVASPADP